MAEVATLSINGEIKIPLRVRTKLGFKPGQKFDVRIQGRDVTLAPLGLPAEEQVKEFLDWTRENPPPKPVLVKMGGDRRRASGGRR